MGYVFLGIAIVCEVAATTALANSQGFTRPVPVVIMAIGYAIAFACLSITVKTIPVGIAYALWSGAGIVLISAIGVVWMGQKLDAPAIFGMALIASGIVVVQAFSSSAHL